jgi:hypothetical protein
LGHRFVDSSRRLASRLAGARQNKITGSNLVPCDLRGNLQAQKHRRDPFKAGGRAAHTGGGHVELVGSFGEAARLPSAILHPLH